MADYRAALERFMATPVGFEWLPQVWHVIYEEGIRGNHILFNAEDIKGIEHAISRGSHDSNGEINWSDELVEEIEDHAVNLLRLNDLDTIRRRVNLLSIEEKLALFLVYQCGLRLWNSALKKSLN